MSTKWEKRLEEHNKMAKSIDARLSVHEIEGSFPDLYNIYFDDVLIARTSFVKTFFQGMILCKEYNIKGGM